MAVTQSIQMRRAELVDRIAAVAREPGPGPFAERLRVSLDANPADRDVLLALIEEMVAAVPGIAPVGPSVAALLRSMVAGAAVTDTFARLRPASDDLEDILTPDDVLRIARVRGQAEATILSQPMFDGARVASALGSTSSNHREFARTTRARSDVIALRDGNRYVFPAFQFNSARHEVWPVVAEVNNLLGAADDPWGVASFWFTPDATLRARPADLVPDRARTHDIRLTAERELAPVG